MTTVIFYEKPGCANNTRQKVLLAAAGHTVLARNLLTEPWTAQRLLAFFGERPVAAWFNRASPKVKSGEIVPEELDAVTALAMMRADPLLIRRPLLEADGLADKLWLIGGNLPAQDHAALRELGFKGIFPSGSRLDAITEFIRNNVGSAS